MSWEGYTPPPLTPEEQRRMADEAIDEIMAPPNPPRRWSFWNSWLYWLLLAGMALVALWACAWIWKALSTLWR